MLWVMKEAHIVFSLLLALQTPILVFPLLINTGECVRQELTPETPIQRVVSFLFIFHSLWSNPLYSRSRFSRLQVQSWSLSVLVSVQHITHQEESLSLVLESQQSFGLICGYCAVTVPLCVIDGNLSHIILLGAFCWICLCCAPAMHFQGFNAGSQ